MENLFIIPHAGRGHDKVPIAVIEVAFGGADLASATDHWTPNSVRNLSLGQAELCDLFQGNPIHIDPGNKYQTETLFTLDSPGRPFAYTLTYNSQ